MAVLVVGVAGGNNTGKSTFSRMLARELGGDTVRVSLSGLLREFYREPSKCPVRVERKENPTGADLLKLGNRLRAEICNGILVRLALKEHSNRSGVLIIDGIRTPGEASELITLDSTGHKPFLVFVTANKSVRLERAKRRGISPKEFEELYRAERTVLKTHVVRKMADYVVNNNSTRQALHGEVVSVVEAIRRRFT